MQNPDDEVLFKEMGIPDPIQTKVTFFGKAAKECEEYSSLAKKVEVKYSVTDLQYHYFVRVGRGELIDPYEANSTLSRKHVSEMFSYRKVSERVFNSFLKYLETKNRIHFTTARRLLLSER
jgi:hypothetical protein